MDRWMEGEKDSSRMDEWMVMGWMDGEIDGSRTDGYW